MTVADLKKRLEGIPDDTPVVLAAQVQTRDVLGMIQSHVRDIVTVEPTTGTRRAGMWVATGTMIPDTEDVDVIQIR
jgi:hypothetical protein